jgi:hypothetical protein
MWGLFVDKHRASKKPDDVSMQWCRNAGAKKLIRMTLSNGLQFFNKNFSSLH